MATRLAFLFLSLALLPASAPAQERPAVVVELFTSQGCNSCPPADVYLGELTRRPELLPLAFHVDYWNYIGWTDPFARPWASARQRAYQKSLNERFVYTPQMVVNGAAEAVGSDRGDIEAALAKAKAHPMPHPSLALERKGDGGLLVHVGAAETKRSATVWLACFDRQHSTPVPRGENAGSTLTNYHIVRHFESLGTWKGGLVDLAVPAAEMAEYTARPDQDMAVLIQVDGVGPIIAAERLNPR